MNYENNNRATSSFHLQSQRKGMSIICILQRPVSKVNDGQKMHHEDAHLYKAINTRIEFIRTKIIASKRTRF